MVLFEILMLLPEPTEQMVTDPPYILPVVVP